MLGPSSFPTVLLVTHCGDVRCADVRQADGMQVLAQWALLGKVAVALTGPWLKAVGLLQGEMLDGDRHVHCFFCWALN